MANGVVRTGRPMEAGEIRVGGDLTHTVRGPEVFAVPSYEAPGIWMPRTTGGGFVYYAPIDMLEFGLSATVGGMGTAESNFTEHVAEFEADPMVELTLGVRLNLPVNEHFTISLIGQAGRVGISQATWECIHEPGSDRPPDPFDPFEPPLDDDPLGGGFDEPYEPDSPRYCTTNEDFVRVRTEKFGRFSGSFMVEPVVLIDEVFSVLMHFGIDQSVRNIGFDPYAGRASQHTLEHFAVGIIGGGVEARFRYGFIGANFDFMVSGQDTIADTAALTLTAGIRRPSDRERAELMPPVAAIEDGPAPPSMHDERTPDGDAALREP